MSGGMAEGIFVTCRRNLAAAVIDIIVLFISYISKVMNNDNRKARIDESKIISTILFKILKRYIVRDECLNASPDEHLFDTACDFISFRKEIVKLAQTLSQLAVYQEMLLLEE